MKRLLIMQTSAAASDLTTFDAMPPVVKQQKLHHIRTKDHVYDKQRNIDKR